MAILNYSCSVALSSAQVAMMSPSFNLCKRAGYATQASTVHSPAPRAMNTVKTHSHTHFHLTPLPNTRSVLVLLSHTVTPSLFRLKCTTRWNGICSTQKGEARIHQPKHNQKNTPRTNVSSSTSRLHAPRGISLVPKNRSSYPIT